MMERVFSSTLCALIGGLLVACGGGLLVASVLIARFSNKSITKKFTNLPQPYFIIALNVSLLIVASKLVACYWIASLLIFVPLVGHSSISKLPCIIKRKYFHFLAVLMFVPPLVFCSPHDLAPFLSLAYSVALAILLYVEALRCYIIPSHPWCVAVSGYFSPFLDSRDGSGPTNVVWSHIYLLIACALPLWVYSMLSECDSVIMHGTVVGINATTSENNLCTFVAPVLSRVYGSSAYRDMFHALFPHLGCLTVGIGDAMAACVGRGFGRIKWFGSKKTLEGSAAMFVSVLFGSVVLLSIRIGDEGVTWMAPSVTKMLVTVAISVCATATELKSPINDNIALPGATMLLFIFLPMLHFL